MSACKHGLPFAFCAVCNNTARPAPDAFRPRATDAPHGESTGRLGKLTAADAAESMRRFRWGRAPVSIYASGNPNRGDRTVSPWREQSIAGAPDSLARMLRQKAIR